MSGIKSTWRNPSALSNGARRAHWACAVCLFRTGLKLKAIGVRLDVSGASVAKWLVGEGMHIKTREKKPGLAERKAECIRLHTVENRGVSYIGKRLGVSKGVCRKYLIRAGVYKVGGRDCKPVDRRGMGLRGSYEAEWKGAKKWDDCGHWARYRHGANKVPQVILDARRANKHRKRKAGMPETNYHIASRLRTRVYNWLMSYRQHSNKRKSECGLSCCELVGCSKAEFKQHLQSFFVGKMQWNNYGKLWEIDHTIPCNSFDLKRNDEKLRCFHFTNQKPMLTRDNRTKSARVIDAQPSLCI